MSALYKKGTEPTEVSSRFATLENPTNGKAEVKGNKITISWDPIKTPSAIEPGSLSNYFNQNFGQWASKYYDRRISYNNSHIGTNGYQIYLRNSNGNLQSLKFTNNNYFEYTVTTSETNYEFVVKSAYSIFKSNMSSGLTIKAKYTNSKPTEPTPPTSTEKLDITLNGSQNVCVEIGKTFVDLKKPVTVKYKQNDITDQAKIEASTNIDTSKKGTINLNYKVTFEEKTGSVTRVIHVCNSCKEDGTCAS